MRILSHLKGRLAWVVDKWLRVNSTIMLFKNSKELKELAVLNVKQYWPLVMYSNYFEIVSTVTF